MGVKNAQNAITPVPAAELDLTNSIPPLPNLVRGVFFAQIQTGQDRLQWVLTLYKVTTVRCFTDCSFLTAFTYPTGTHPVGVLGSRFP